MNFKDKLKDAICNDDFEFLDQNKELYSVDERFEDEDNDTLLLYSISYSESNSFEYFLRNNADISLVNDIGENVLHATIYSREIERLKKLLKNYKVDINFRAKDGCTPLLLSLSLEEFEITDLLIKYGADVNIADIEGISPLHVAAQLDNLFIVVELVEKGANLFAKTTKGNLPLALAVNHENKAIISYLYHKVYG